MTKQKSNHRNIAPTGDDTQRRAVRRDRIWIAPRREQRLGDPGRSDLARAVQRAHPTGEWAVAHGPSTVVREREEGVLGRCEHRLQLGG